MKSHYGGRFFTDYYNKKNRLPVIDSIYKNILSLPIYPKLKFFEQEIIIKKIENYIKKVH